MIPFFQSLFKFIKGMQRLGRQLKTGELISQSKQSARKSFYEIKKKYPHYWEEWTQGEVDYLIQHYATGSKGQLVKQLKRPWGAIRAKADALRSQGISGLYRRRPELGTTLSSNKPISWDTFIFAPKIEEKTGDFLDEIWNIGLKKPRKK